MLKEPFEPRFAPGVRTRGEARRDETRRGSERFTPFTRVPSVPLLLSLARSLSVTPLHPGFSSRSTTTTTTNDDARAFLPTRSRRRDVEERMHPLSPCTRSSSPSHARARARPRRTRRGIETETTRSPSVSYSSRRASTRLRRAGPVYNPSPPPRGCERELRGLGHAVGSRDPDLLSSCADRTRGGGRAPLREITAGTPL